MTEEKNNLQKIIRNKRDIASLIEGDLVKIGIAYPVGRFHVYAGKKDGKYNFITQVEKNRILHFEISWRGMYVKDETIFIFLNDYSGFQWIEYEYSSPEYSKKYKIWTNSLTGEKI